MLSDDLLRELTLEEGLKLKPYLDCCSKPWRECSCPPEKRERAKLTIAIGVNLDDGLTADEAKTLTLMRIRRAIFDAGKVCRTFNSLDPWRQFVLSDMAFNMGYARLSNFKKMLAAIERQDWSAAADEMLASQWDHQVGHRAQRLAQIMRTGQFVPL